MKHITCALAGALFLAPLWLGQATAACVDLNMEVQSSRLLGADFDPAGDLPDVYLEVRLFADAPCQIPRIVRTVTREQSIGGHPFEGYHLFFFRAAELNQPFRMEWGLWDDDGTGGRDLIIAGADHVGAGPTEGHCVSTSPDAQIVMWPRSPDWTASQTYPPHTHTRYLDPAATLNASTTVYLEVYGPGALADSVDVYEQIPPGFVFQNATPPATEVTTISGAGPGEGDLGTLLRWRFAPWDSKKNVQYDVITPASAEQMAAPFGCEVWTYGGANSVVCASGLAPDQVAFGGVLQDCNANGQDDWFEIVGNGSLDCNSNGAIDACEIAAGLISDCDGDGVPDRCEIENGTSLDENLNGVPDECESATSVDVAPPTNDAWIEARPNPAGGGATVVFRTRERGVVRVNIFDAGGRRVATLVDGTRDPGVHAIAWDRRGADGRSVPPGIYLITLETPGGARASKTTLLR